MVTLLGGIGAGATLFCPPAGAILVSGMSYGYDVSSSMVNSDRAKNLSWAQRMYQRAVAERLEKCQPVEEEIDRQRRQGESRTREYQAAQEKNRQLQEQVRQVEEKSKLYDEAAVSIGSAILQAQQTAQSNVDEAGGQAKEIVDRANTQAQAITDDAQRFIDRVLQKMDDMQQEFLTLRGRMDESINQLNNRFAQLDEDIVHARELVTNIRERLTQQEEEQGQPGKPPVQPPEQRSRLDMTR